MTEAAVHAKGRGLSDRFVKIAFVVHDYHRHGGHSRYTVELAERFARDHEVHVFANRIEDDGSAPIRFHRVPAVRATALTTILSFPLVASRALARGFDVVHAQGFVCSGANVITAHICSETWYAARRRSSDSIRLKEHLFAAIVNRLERRLFQGSPEAEVIAVSRRVADDLRDAYGRTDRVSVVYHGVDLDCFTPSLRGEHRNQVRDSLGIRPDALVALYVGDLRKGGRTAIEALRSAPGWRLVTVSRTPSEPYAAFAAECGVSDRIVLAPPTDAIAGYYGAADAFLFPSENDAFGMVVTEAMASGLPVIVSAAAGASEVVSHGESGYVLDVATDAATAGACLASWSANRESLATMGGAARRAVLPYTWDAIAEQTMEVYRRVLPRSGR